MSDPLRQGLTPKMKPVPARRSFMAAALDVGTSKITCLVGRLKPLAGGGNLRSHSIECLGCGHVRSRGVKAGTVVDLAAAESAIRTAIDAAEKAAGAQLESVIISLGAGRLGSERYHAEVATISPAVNDGDIHRVLVAANQTCIRDGRVILHSLPNGFALDGAMGIRDARGMIGQRLGVDMHVVTSDMGPARNLMLVVERAHLNIEAMVAAPYASGLAVLSDDEPDLGVIVIDMGAGTTSLAVFTDGTLIHTDAVALGGHQVTMDIARGVSTSVTAAERIKTLHASVVAGPSDERELITLPAAGADDRDAPTVISRATLIRIARPRVEETLELVRDRLIQAGFGGTIGARVVLTGGASQLTGLPDLAARILGRQVRIGRPAGIAGLPEAARCPTFATAAGLLAYPQFAHLEHFEGRGSRFAATGSDGYLSRVGRWLKESF